MKSNEKYGEIGETDAQAPALYSEAWWAGRTTAELQHYLKRGFAAGDVFYAAAAESSRREWETRERAGQRRIVDSNVRNKERLRQSLRVVLGVAAVAIVAIATVLIV